MVVVDKTRDSFTDLALGLDRTSERTEVTPHSGTWSPQPASASSRWPTRVFDHHADESDTEIGVEWIADS